jgi:hypothetical protein
MMHMVVLKKVAADVVVTPDSMARLIHDLRHALLRDSSHSTLWMHASCSHLTVFRSSFYFTNELLNS